MAPDTTFGPPAHMAAFSDVDKSWGPLAKLAGQWTGDQGRDFSYSYSEKNDTENLYREEITFDPFGPVDNGQQSLFGLDYRMKAWRIGADDFFRTVLRALQGSGRPVQEFDRTAHAHPPPTNSYHPPHKKLAPPPTKT